MKPKYVFEFEDFVSNIWDEELNEELIEEEDIQESFASSPKGSRVFQAEGERFDCFSSPDKFYEFAHGKGFPTAPGFDNKGGMKLTEWMGTDGFEKCEQMILEAIERNDSDEENKKTVAALKSFKSERPEIYALMVMWATHDIFPKSKNFPGKQFRKSPLRRRGKKPTLFARHTLSPKKKANPDLGQITKGSPTYLPRIAHPFRTGVDTSDFFRRDSWELSDEFKKLVANEIVKPASQIIGKCNCPENQPKGYISAIDVTASCSTIPNKAKKDGKPLTFKELADLRANAALEYVKNELAKIGVIMDKNTVIKIDTDGKNKGKKLTSSLGSLPSGTDLTGTSGEIWDGKLSSRDDPKYKSNQMIWIDPEIVFNYNNPEEENKPGGEGTPPGIQASEAPENTYTVWINNEWKKIGITWELQWPFIDWEIIKSKRHRGFTGCPWK